MRGWRSRGASQLAPPATRRYLLGLSEEDAVALETEVATQGGLYSI